MSADVISEHENRLAKWFDNWFVTIKEPTTYDHMDPGQNQINRCKDE